MEPRESRQASNRSQPALASRSAVLSIVSDTICPWCFVGKRRLEAVLPTLQQEGFALSVEWLPYQLNPDMPDKGMDRATYRAAKFGSITRSRDLDAQMTAVGSEVGIDFHYERIARTPNTLASHVLIADARRAGGERLQDRTVEALFTAYFVEGRDIGRQAVLRDIARTLGFEHGPSVSADLIELVDQQSLVAREAGIHGVPTLLFNEQFLLSGAQSPSVLLEALRQALTRPAGATAEFAS
ncbi:DsbA family oxidoreductase [Sphingomonas pituitosa]|uniref:DsbA family oxidoreductase n=1 Tax=Sphingomonas pituitosa TaxID=99597 RepID=UPI00082CB680|nr:DsbA family oxidoreductase [Sphingomonas pituitosa]